MRIVQRAVNQKKANELAKKHNIDINTVKFLLGRGYEEDLILLLTAKDVGILYPHDSITNVPEVAYEIAEYIQNDNAKIFIYGDYDSDGINSSFIMGDCIQQLINVLGTKCEVEVHLPNRSEGYGLNLNWCEKVEKEISFSGKDALVITVDNGITKRDEVAFLLNHGINCIITDHHVPKEGHTPEEVLIVDPWLNDLDNANAKGLCGAAVAYKVCAYLLETVYQDESGFHMIYVPHVAIATITDVMPVTEENISLIKNGLNLIEEGYCTDGIKHYREYSGKQITTKDIAFELGPQINACGRMGQTEKAGELFFGGDSADVSDVYNEIFKINESRKDKQKEIVAEIFKETFENDLMIIKYVKDLGGLGGPVASKIVEKYQKPCILLTGEGNILHGSARSIGNLDLQDLFAQEVKKNNLLDFGGHEAAAGVYIKKDKLNKLQKSLNETLSNMNIEIVSEDPSVLVDGTIKLADIKKATVTPYQDITFFGDLKEPTFVIENVKINNTRCSNNNKENICFNMTDGSVKLKTDRRGNLIGKELWAWGYASKYKELGSPTTVNVIGQVVPDFRNPKLYTLSIQDIIPA